MIPIRTTAPSGKLPIMTVTLIALNVIAFFCELGLSERQLTVFINEFGVIPRIVVYGFANFPLRTDIWLGPLFTAMFLHGGWAHLIGNMLYLWVFGGAVEAAFGHARFLGFYLASGVLAFVAQIAAGPMVDLPTIGASGAVAAVLGAHLMLFRGARVTVLFPIFIFPIFFEIWSVLFLGIWFLQQLFSGAVGALSPEAASAGIAWWAHAGGFIVGVLFARSWCARLLPSRDRHWTSIAHGE